MPAHSSAGTAPSGTPSRPGEMPTLIALAIGGVVLTLAHRLSADEAQVLTGAWNLFNGQRIYEDFFEFIGPASFAWVDLFFRAFGPHYAAALVSAQVLLVGSLLAFWGVGRSVVGTGAPLVAATVLWLVIATAPPFINHNSYSSFLATGFAYCMVVVLQGGTRRYAAAAGGLAALTFFFLQPKGAALLAVGAVTLVALDRARPRPNTFGPFLIGAAGVGAVGFWIWGFWPIAALLTVALGNVAMNHLTLSYLPLIGAAVLGVLVAWACHREGLLDRAAVFLLLLQAGLWGSTLHLPDAWHMAINSFPLLILLGKLAIVSLRSSAEAYAGAEAGEGAPPVHWARAPCSARLLTSLFVLVVGLWVGRSLVRNVQDTRVAAEWRAVLEAELGGEPFFAFTFLPSFYLELNVPNPYFNSVLYVGSHPAEHFERNVEVLLREQPPFVLADYATVARYGHSMNNPVDEYIRGHYRLKSEFAHQAGVVEVWERR